MKKTVYYASIGAVVLGGALLLLNLMRLVQGTTEFLDAERVVLESAANRAEAVASIRSVGFWQWFFMTAGTVALLGAGVTGFLFREKPQKRLLPVILSAAALIFWILMCVFYVKLAPLLEEQGMFGEGETPALVVTSLLFAGFAAVYTVSMIRERQKK